MGNRCFPDASADLRLLYESPGYRPAIKTFGESIEVTDGVSHG
jgi:hypothetical protein